MLVFGRMSIGGALWREEVLPFCKVGFRHIRFFVMARNRDAIPIHESLCLRVCGFHRRLVDWDSEFLNAVEME